MLPTSCHVQFAPWSPLQTPWSPRLWPKPENPRTVHYTFSILFQTGPSRCLDPSRASWGPLTLTGCACIHDSSFHSLSCNQKPPDPNVEGRVAQQCLSVMSLLGGTNGRERVGMKLGDGDRHVSRKTPAAHGGEGRSSGRGPDGRGRLEVAP